MNYAEGGAVSRQLSVTIEEIEQIAKGVMAHAEEAASKSSSSFSNLKLADGTFGEVPLAQALARQHEGAHEVFVDTVKGLVEDLQDFQQRLIDSADAHRNTDDSAYDALVSVGRRYGKKHTYRSRHNWKKSVQDHGGGSKKHPDGPPASGPSHHGEGGGNDSGSGNSTGGRRTS